MSQEDSDDDQTLSQLTVSSNNNGFRSRTRRNLEPTGSHSSGDPNPGPSSAATSSRMRESSRSVTVTTQNSSSNLPEPIPSSSQSSATSHSEIARRSHRSQVLEDHNYGDPGPLPIRHSRRSNVTLSRHQRNADELDTSISHSIPGSSTSSFTPASSSPTAPTTTSGRLRQRTVATQPIRPVPPVASSSRHNPVPASAYLDESDNSSDPDDDKPLRQRETSTQDDHSAIRRSRHFPVDDAGPSTSRSSRTLKRPYYNEDSDDDAQGSSKRPQKRVAQQSTSAAAVPTISQILRTTRQSYPVENFSDDDTEAPNANHNDDSSDVSDDHDLSDEDEDGEPSISVSSRGRVRKITAKARGIFRE